ARAGRAGCRGGGRCRVRPVLVRGDLVGPVLVGPVLVGPVLVGPVLVRPVLVGRELGRVVLVGPVLVRAVLVGPELVRLTNLLAHRRDGSRQHRSPAAATARPAAGVG